MADRKTVTIGDLVASTDRETQEQKQTKEGCNMYHLQVYLPDGVDEIVLKKGDYINARELTEEEIKKMPDWKQQIVQLKFWVPLK